MANGSESAASKIFVGLVVTVGGGLVLAFLVGQLGLNGGGSGGGGSTRAPEVTPVPARTPIASDALEITTNPPPPPSTAPIPQTGCVLTVTFTFAEMYAEPRHDATRVGDVPVGKYPSANSTIANWGGRDERWFEIAVESRTGWIVDDGFQIDSKSADCP